VQLVKKITELDKNLEKGRQELQKVRMSHKIFFST